jgi:serine/threonine protein kinase
MSYGGFYVENGGDESIDPLARTTSIRVRDEPGTVLAGRYRLIEPIGVSLTGLVWRCHDHELDGEIAIKLLRIDVNGAADAARLRNKARQARRVTHPNVGRVFEFGSCETHYFMTMEYIVGESLRAWLARGEPMRPTWVQALAMGLCRGLAAALAVGMVHGMIRPSNILLAPGRGVVLTAFEIGGPFVEQLAGVIRPNDLPYLAPERLRGGEATPRSDVFTVGVVLFEALTGRLPWPSQGEEMLESLYAGYEPPLRELAPDVPEAWLDLIGECLAVDPGRRPADVRSLLVRLGAGPGRESGPDTDGNAGTAVSRG